MATGAEYKESMSGEAPLDVRTMLAEMDTALADEITVVQRRERSSGRIAREGQLVSELGSEYIYAYSLDEPWEPEDGTPLTIKMPDAPPLRATVVTASGTGLTIATESELPPAALAQIILVDDPLQLLERLRETLKNGTEGPSRLGSKAFNLIPFATGRDAASYTWPDFTPRESQADAIRLALGSEVAYIIGPPGTGKTLTLAAIAFALALQGRTVLMAAHTNIAVDNAILKLADMCHKADMPALRVGRIIRYGTPQLQSVRQRDDIYPPKIVKRMGLDLEKERADLRASHSRTLDRLGVLEQHEEHEAIRWAERQKQIVDQRKAFSGELLALQQVERQRISGIDAALRTVEQAQQQAARGHEDARRELDHHVALQSQLEHAHTQRLTLFNDLTKRLAAAQAMSSIGRLLKGIHLDRLVQQVADAKQQVWQDERSLDDTKHRMEAAHRAIASHRRELDGLRVRQEELTVQRHTPPDVAGRTSHLQAEIERYDRDIAEGRREREHQASEAARERGQLQSTLEQFSQQMASLDEQLRDLERRLLDDAQVVATTLSKVYMDARLRERRFDAVILDEVSMAPLPAAYVAASHADRHVVAIGDPLQLAPIVRAATPTAKKWLGQDLFELVGITLAQAAGGDRRSSVLKEQFRMHPSISAIARKHVYSGLVKDAPQIPGQDYGAVLPMPGTRLLLCDTSDGAPVTSRPGSSRINLYHAVCALSVAREILASLPEWPPDPSNPFRVGIVTPYRKQAELIQRMVKTEGLERRIRVGTVHRFQGLEFEAVVFDTVESPPVPHRQDFVGGGSGQRLVNVAVTRPQHKLVVIANARHIFARFDEADTLRLAVSEAHQADVIKSRALLGALGEALDPGRLQARERMGAAGLHIPQIEWLDDTAFFERFLADVRTSTSSIVIYSPFVRMGRTAALIPELRAKCASGVRVAVVASQSEGANRPVDVPAVEALTDAGVEFHTSPGLHEKVVLIDDSIVYFGSLNPLSQNATTELMQRIASPLMAEQVARMVRVAERAAPANWGEHLVIPFGQLPAGGPCPECGRPLQARLGQYGAFYGCNGFPECKYTQEVVESQLVSMPALARVQCDKCSAGHMRPRARRKDLWLECAAASPCDRRRKLVIQRL